MVVGIIVVLSYSKVDRPRPRYDEDKEKGNAHVHERFERSECTTFDLYLTDTECNMRMVYSDLRNRTELSVDICSPLAKSRQTWLLLYLWRCRSWVATRCCQTSCNTTKCVGKSIQREREGVRTYLRYTCIHFVNGDKTSAAQHLHTCRALGTFHDNCTFCLPGPSLHQLYKSETRIIRSTYIHSSVHRSAGHAASSLVLEDRRIVDLSAGRVQLVHVGVGVWREADERCGARESGEGCRARHVAQPV